MKKPRIVALLMIALLMLGVMAGCGAPSKEPSQEPTAAPETSAPVATDETVTLEFMHTFWVEAMVDVLNDAVAAFEADNPNIQINQTQVSWTDANSQYMTSIMGGKAPDIIVTNPGLLASFRGINALADITDRVPEDLIANLKPIAVDIITNAEGRIDGMPEEGCNWGLFYRKDLFEEAGLDPDKAPTNWEEFVEYAKALTKDTDGDGVIDQWGYGWPVQAENANDYWINFMYQAGGNFDVYNPETGAYESNLTGAEATVGTQFMVDLVRKDKVSPESLVEMDWEAVTNGFVDGTFAMMHNGAWVVGSVHSKGPDIEGKWGTALLFDGPAGAAYRGHPNTFNITNASTKQDQAWQFLEYLYTQGADTNADGLSWVEQLCLAGGALCYTNSYEQYAYDTYEDLLIPFVDASAGAKVPPMDPAWMTFSELYGITAVQRMIMGEVSVEDGLQQLDANLKSLQ